MAKITTAQFQKGMFIEFRGEPHQITDMQFVNPGKGSAFVRTKLKNIKSGRVQEFTYKSGETVMELPIGVREMQYLYKSGDVFIFMDNDSYEQLSIPAALLGSFSLYLREGDIHQVLIHEGNAVGMRFPQKVKLKVIEADEGAKGNTASGAKKLVRVETGAQVTTPLFIKNGDIIAIDPETGEYLERVSS